MPPAVRAASLKAAFEHASGAAEQRPPGDPRTLRDLLMPGAPGESAQSFVIALSPGGGTESCTRHELACAAGEVAGELLRSGLRTGEPVLLAGPNGIEWIVGFFGILSGGGLPVPVDASLGARELALIARDCGARRAFAGPRQSALLNEVSPGVAVTSLGSLWRARGPESGSAPELPLLPALAAGDCAALFYTSGTTGSPKAVPLTHANLLANVNALVGARLTGPADRVLLPLPLHHAYPFTCALLGCLATGTVLVLPAAVTGPDLAAAIRATGATVLLGVPRLYAALLAGIESRITARPAGRWAWRTALALSSRLGRDARIRLGRLLFARLHRAMGRDLRLLVSGGARLDARLALRLETLGWTVLSGYGLTETSPILTFNVPGHVRHESVGRPLPGVDLRIGGGASGDGEILARGPNVFVGYRNNAEATQAAFTADGWFRTGDVGHVDEGGYLHIVGRVKEIIVLADGKKVVPEEVEAFYAASPLIREVALLEQDGRLAALVVPDDEAIRVRGAARLADLLRDEIERRSLELPAWQRIGSYRIAHEPLPRTSVGKLQRFRLGELFAAAGSSHREPVEGPLAAADRELLGSPLGQHIFTWLQERFAGKPLTLDASPQLDLGVDSLEWVALTLEIRDRFGVELGPEAIARVLTVRDLLQAVRDAPAASPLSAAAGTSEAGADTRGPVLRAAGLALYALDRLLLRVFFRLQVRGAGCLPGEGAVLLAPNHSSYLDPLAIAAALPWPLLRRARWAGSVQYMFRAPHWRLLSRAGGVFPVDADRGPAAALAAGRAVLARGAVLTWFPEGRRSLDGAIGPFLPGVGLLLREAGVPAVPVLVEGSFEALPWHRPWPRPARIVVTFGEPRDAAALEALGEGATPAERIATGLRRAVASLAREAQCANTS